MFFASPLPSSAQTFYGGWTDRQLPDGTEILAGYSPSRSVICVSRGTNRDERSILCVSSRPLVNRYRETRPDTQLFAGGSVSARQYGEDTLDVVAEFLHVVA